MKMLSEGSYEYAMPDFFTEIDEKEWGKLIKPGQGSIRIDLARTIILFAVLVTILTRMPVKNELKEQIKAIDINISKAFGFLQFIQALHKYRFTKSAEKKDCLIKIQQLLKSCSDNYQTTIEIIANYDKVHVEKFFNFLNKSVELVEKIDVKFLMGKIFKVGFIQNMYLTLCKVINPLSKIEQSTDIFNELPFILGNINNVINGLNGSKPQCPLKLKL